MAYPNIGHALCSSNVLLGWAFTLYMLVTRPLGVIIGPLSKGV